MKIVAGEYRIAGHRPVDTMTGSHQPDRFINSVPNHLAIPEAQHSMDEL